MSDLVLLSGGSLERPTMPLSTGYDTGPKTDTDHLNPQGQYTLVRRTKQKYKEKVTRHICPKLKVIKTIKWASKAPLQGQKRQKKDQLICLSQWHQSRYGWHIFIFNICFGFGEDATNDHYDVTATSEKDDYGKGRFKSHLKAQRLRQTTPTYTAASQ